jgi:hypothetical protein
MSASRPLVPFKTIALEAVGISALAIGVAALLSPHDVGLASLFPHPIWLAVALLAGRYGSRGLGAGLIIGWIMMAGVAVALRVPATLLIARTSSGPDLGTLLAVVLVGWVASTHERRCGELTATVASLKERCAADHETAVALRATALALRARADRLETSLTFLRDVATRLEGNDPAEAGQAALDLVMARVGARAGAVAVIDEKGPSGFATLASSGHWQALDLQADRTAAAALRNRRATRAIDIDVADGSTGDSDLAAPIFGPGGDHLVGLILLRGVPQGGASAASLHDLTLVAAWCARAVGHEAAGDHARGVGLLSGLDDGARTSSSTGVLSEAPGRSVSRLNL